MPSFKTDESFLEKISIGAIGTQKVFKNLREQGFHPIELERGSMSYKIWKKIKIKRIRVPDILLVDNGIRIESRAKTKLEMTMSHSESDPDRGWDYGLKDNDFVALVFCEKYGEEPIAWKAHELVQYISVKDLRLAFKKNQIELVKPKGAEEGFEARLKWPSSVASENGTIKEINKDRIQYKRDSDGRTISLSLKKKGIKLKPLVKEKDQIIENQIIASVVPVYHSLSFPKVKQDFFLANLNSKSLSERYAAAKALTFFQSKESEKGLIERIKDKDEHIYVKLESAASLARFKTKLGYDYIEECLKDSYAQHVLEAVIVLAEIKTKESCNLLIKVLLDDKFDSEIRAGAAWALGEQSESTSLPALIKSFNAVDENIKVEAARGLAKLTRHFTPEILKEFNKATADEKPGIAWALTKTDSLKLGDFIATLTDEESRKWISYIIGVHGEELYIKEIEALKKKDPEVYFAVTVLWKIMTSWVFNLKEY